MSKPNLHFYRNSLSYGNQ